MTAPNIQTIVLPRVSQKQQEVSDLVSDWVTLHSATGSDIADGAVPAGFTARFRKSQKAPVFTELKGVKVSGTGVYHHARVHHHGHHQEATHHFGNHILLGATSAALEKSDSVDSFSSDVDSASPDFEKFYEDHEGKKLLALDPAKWKDQDHYAVLGLGKMRFLATDDDIKKAYRRKALKHHPDKGGSTANFFKCVQKAYEFMSEPVKRRMFDSVDDKFDESIPSNYQPSTGDFFDTFGPVFQRNAHYSKTQPVPHLGSQKTPRAQVEEFYDFWAAFSSWRTFELKDEELPSENDCRDERRWIEKQNKAQRAKLVKDDRSRLMKLVDLSMLNDPRLKQYKLDDKLAKEAKKFEKERASREAEEEAKRAKEAELEELNRAENERKAALDSQKADVKQKKQLIKNERRDFRQTIGGAGCFGGNFDGVPTVAEVEKYVVELLAAYGEDLEKLNVLHVALKKAASPLEAWTLFQAAYDALESKQHTIVQPAPKATEVKKPAAQANADKAWTDEEIKLLIKAVNQFPGGVQNRWVRIAEYIQAHAAKGTPLRKTDDIIQKSKEVKSKDYIKNSAQLQKVERPSVVIADAPTQTPASIIAQQEQAAASVGGGGGWSVEEQALLEKALKAYPSSGPNAYKGTDRWEKVTAVVKSRTKKEVIARVKEIIQNLQKK